MKLATMSDPEADAASIIIEGLPDQIETARGVFVVKGYTICKDPASGPVVRARGKYVGIEDGPMFLCSKITCPVVADAVLRLRWEEV